MEQNLAKNFLMHLRWNSHLEILEIKIFPSLRSFVQNGLKINLLICSDNSHKIKKYTPVILHD